MKVDLLKGDKARWTWKSTITLTHNYNAICFISDSDRGIQEKLEPNFQSRYFARDSVQDTIFRTHREALIRWRR